MSDTPTGNDPTNPFRTPEDKARIDELLATVHFIPRRTEESRMADKHIGMDEFEKIASGPLQGALRAIDEATGGVVAQRFPKRFTEQLNAVSEALATPSDEDTTQRLVVLYSILVEVAGILDAMLPPGRHKSLCMTAWEDVMVRMFLALRCDDRES